MKMSVPLVFFTFISCIILSVYAQKDNNPNCSCYVTSHSPTSYFLYHRFQDFRSVPATASNNYLTPPALLTAKDFNVIKPVTSPFLQSDGFQNNFEIETWVQSASTDSPVALMNSPRNVYISRDNASSPTHLTLRSTRLPTFQSAGELDSNFGNIFYASIRINARIRGSPGACAGLFLFGNDQNESDIEILTRDPTSVFRASNQPDLDKAGNSVVGASSVVKIPTTSIGNGIQVDNSWTSWTTYRLDWIKGRSQWFANDVSLSNKTYGAPKIGSEFIINLWGNGGIWSGNMSVGGQATMDIQWVDMVYNTSSRGSKKRFNARNVTGCKQVCRVDGVKAVGFPELASLGAWLPRVKGLWFQAWMLALGIAVFKGI